jgi:hypothetical protein
MSEAASPPRVETGSGSLRVVGFKCDPTTTSPTSVCGAAASSPRTIDSPRSSLADALRSDQLRPLPRLTILTRPRQSLGAALKKSKSHADLLLPAARAAPAPRAEGSAPASPASRASSSVSTPMRIPVELARLPRVHTAPHALCDLGAALPAAVAGAATARLAPLLARHRRSLSMGAGASPLGAPPRA